MSSKGSLGCSAQRPLMVLLTWARPTGFSDLVGWGAYDSEEDTLVSWAPGTADKLGLSLPGSKH